MNRINCFSNYLLRYNTLFKSELNRVLAYHSLDRKRVLELQNQLFLKTFNVACHKSSFYKSLYSKYGVNIKQIQNLEDITKLPIVTKEDIRNHTQTILTTSPLLLVKGYTSGTSGTPLVLYRNYASVLKENAYLWAYRIISGHQLGARAISLRGDLDANTKEFFDPYTNTLYLSSYSLKEENAYWYYEKIAKFKPRAIYAYPSSMETLSNLLQGIDKQIKIDYVFTSSETVYDFQREKIAEVFGSRVFDWYGNAERSIALEESFDGTYQEAPLYSINEYNENCVYTTSLFNTVFPLIRYEVDDVIDFKLIDNQEIKISGIQGRKDDYLIFFDGTKIGRMSGTLKGVNNIKYTQFVQNNPHEFVVNVVPTANFNHADEHLLYCKIKSKVNNIPFEIKMVEEKDIIKTKAGKYKLIVNSFQKSDMELNEYR